MVLLQRISLFGKKITNISLSSEVSLENLNRDQNSSMVHSVEKRHKDEYLTEQ